jgi:dTDP-glucose pyrophosphorylase
MNSNIQALLIHCNTDLRQAMKQLEVTEKKILFVVADGSKLYGTLTDGDIRRWILGGGELQETVDKLCNRRPFSVRDGYDLDQVRQDMIQNSILSVPIVNEQTEIVDILFWEALFFGETQKKLAPAIDIPVVIMAGGKGTRLDPFTKILPKPLIPIGEKTVIEVIIDAFRDWGIAHFYVSVNHKSKIIKSYFEELNPPYTIEYIDEEIPLGTAGGLRKLIGRMDGSFLVTNCDVIIKVDCRELVRHHHSNQNDLTLVASLKNYHIPYGICEIQNGGTLARITEKPEYSFLVNTGMYLLKPEILNLIPPGECFHMTQLIDRLRETGGKVGVFPIGEDSWLDTGEWAEYQKALKKFEL